MKKVPFEEFIAAGMASPTVKSWSQEEKEKYTNIARKVWEESTPQRVQQLTTETNWWSRQRLRGVGEE